MTGAVSFGFFGTLVEAAGSVVEAAAVGAELERRGVAVPEDWQAAFDESHVDAPPGTEVPLPAHVHAALRSRGVSVGTDPEGRGNVVRRAVVAAVDPDVRTRDGAVAAVAAAADRGPVGVLSNCRVPELAGRVLHRSAVDRDDLDALVTSAGCGWRKPHQRAFETVAGRLGVSTDELVHVGDDPLADGRAADAGAAAVLLADAPLGEFPARLASGDLPP